MIEYEYDAWGNWLNKETSGITQLGKILVNINPFIYKGYIFDQETNLYYLKSRYYSPILRRFISPDTLIGDVGNIENYNLYTYVMNNPLMHFDDNGTFGKKIISQSVNFFKKIGKFIGETVEFSVQFTKTAVEDIKYYLFATVETGVQIDLDTSTGKLFNFSINTPSNPWNFWGYSFGLDVKVKGVGFGIGIGGENYLSLHWKESTFSVFGNALGRIGIEIKTDINDYSSNYSRLSLNAPEILAAGALIYFAAPTLIPLILAALIIA